jgi:hypothetical protein
VTNIKTLFFLAAGLVSIGVLAVGATSGREVESATAAGTAAHDCSYSERSRASLRASPPPNPQEYAQLRAEMTAGFTSTRAFITGTLGLMVTLLGFFIKSVIDQKESDHRQGVAGALSITTVGTLMVLLLALSEVVTGFLRQIYRQGSYLRVVFEERVQPDGHVCIREFGWLSATRPLRQMADDADVGDRVRQLAGDAIAMTAAEADAVTISGITIVIVATLGLAVAWMRLAADPAKGWFKCACASGAVLGLYGAANVFRFAQDWLKDGASAGLVVVPFFLWFCLESQKPLDRGVRWAQRVGVVIVLLIACGSVASISLHLVRSRASDQHRVENLYRCLRDAEARRASGAEDVWHSPWCEEDCRVPVPAVLCDSSPN